METPSSNPQSPPAPPSQTQPLSADDRTMGMLAHLVTILASIIGAVIFYLVSNDRSEFVRHHAKEALNFQITVLIVTFSFMIIAVIGTFITFGIGIFIVIPLSMALGIGILILEIMACIAANKGEWHHYPWCIRFIK